MQNKIRKSFILLFSAVIAVVLFGCTLMFMPKTTAKADAEEAHDHSTMTAINSYADIENGELTAGAYYIGDNIDGNITVTGEVTLCLNGHTVTGDGNGSVITVSENANFTLCDCRETGIITGGTGCGVGIVLFGGGVYVNENGSFTMTGGTISGNTAMYGSGVYVNGPFIMTGGTISNNAADGYGGGVHVTNTIFTMAGGTIEGNTAGNWGTGVYVVSSTFRMSGGTIEGNTTPSPYRMGGVLIFAGTFEISGAPVITGNMANDSESNVSLLFDSKITVAGELTEGAQIGVMFEDGFSGVFATGYAQADKPSKYFIPDNPENCVYVSDETSDTVTVAEQHDIITHEAQQPTCTENGWEEYGVCSRGDYAIEKVEIEALGHTEVSDDNAVAATCTQTGVTASTSCSVCNTVVQEQTTVDALGHSYGEWTVVKQATESEEGEERRVCVNDNTHYETRTIPKLTPSTPTPTPDNNGSDKTPSAPAEEKKSYWWLFCLPIPLAIGVGGVTLGIWVYKNKKNNNRL